MTRAKMSRPSSSVPNRWLDVGPFSRLKGSISLGWRTPGSHLAPRAQITTAASHTPHAASPICSRILRRLDLARAAVASATSTAGGSGAPPPAGADGSSSRSDMASPDPGVEHGVEDVDDEVHDDKGGGDEQR